MNGLQVRVLPDEILSVICEQLGRDGEHATLYRCARACQSLADPALRIMYQYHELSPTFLQNEDNEPQSGATTFEEKQKQAMTSFRRWTLIWRSIISSSLDAAPTYKPYCRYLRILDFRNLQQMLEDPKFYGKDIERYFFGKDLKPFHILMKEGKRQVIDTVAMINAIGETVVPKTFLVEEITGNLSPGFLARWVSAAHQLASLVLFRGDALGEDAGVAIAKSCEHFQSLTLHHWRKSGEHQADDICGEFLTGMRPLSLQHFEVISSNDLQRASFAALGLHDKLQVLKLSSMCREAVESLNALKACTNLHTLVLDASVGTVQMSSEVFDEVVQWLSSCDSLRDLALSKIWDGPAILAPVLSSPHVRLTKLSLEGADGYKVRQQSAGAFHTALNEQRTLEHLSLRGDGEDTTPNDLELLVDSLTELKNLRELHLRDVSDEFEETHISTLALSLPQLEDFWTGGGEVSANVLAHISSMENLKTLNMSAQTQFTSEQILSFLKSLDAEKQKGFTFFLMAADPDYDLDEHEQDDLRRYVQQYLEGRFDFQIWRDPDESGDEDYD